MTSESARGIMHALDQIVETLAAATFCAQEARAAVQQSLDSLLSARSDTAAGQRPLLDESTLTLSWEGRTCRLGLTITYRLAERLFRRPNHFVNPEQLLQDVWRATRSDETIRSAIRNLRRRLKASGMDRLAAAIQCQGGRYGLMLDGGV